jgi:hypothetical protein
MNKQSRKVKNLFIRYIIILLAGLGLPIFYRVLKPLNIKALYFILSIFSEVSMLGELISIKGVLIELIPACLAGSAFYLLFILTLSVPEIRPFKQVKIIIFSFIVLFLLNLIRILILLLLLENPYFGVVHWILWHIISTLFVVGIWIASVKVYKIKSIPVYSDVNFLRKLIKPVKKSKRKH